MPFKSIEFKNFARDWDFQTIMTIPFHSQSNGLAEKSVSIVKSMLRRAFEGNQDIYVSLIEHRNTLLGDINLSPAHLMLSRRTKTKIPPINMLLTRTKL